MCRKRNIGSDSVLKQPNRQNITHPFRLLYDRNCMQSAIQIKNDKNNFTCIQHAEKNVLKHNQMMTHYAFVTVY